MLYRSYFEVGSFSLQRWKEDETLDFEIISSQKVTDTLFGAFIQFKERKKGLWQFKHDVQLSKKFSFGTTQQEPRNKVQLCFVSASRF